MGHLRNTSAIMLLAGVLAAQAAQGVRISGPEPGRALPAIRVYGAVGEHAGREIDVARQLAKDTGALLFIHELSRNTAPVIRGLDEIARERGLLGFRYVPILLHSDRTEGEMRLEAVNGSLRLANPIVLSLDGVEGPGELALNRKCTLTLILTKDGTVARSVGLTDTGRHDVPRLEEWVAELNGPLPQSEAEWLQRVGDRLPATPQELKRRLIRALLANQRLQSELRTARTQLRQARRGVNPRRRAMADRGQPGSGQPMSRPPAEKRIAGKPPTDQVLRGLIRTFINKRSSSDEIDDVYLEITTYAEGSSDLERQVYDMFRLVLSAGYGAPRARSLAKTHVGRFDREKKSRRDE